MKNRFKDNLWRKVWIGNEILDSSFCETCYGEAEEMAKEEHSKLKGDKLLDKVFEILDDDFSGEIFGELWCNGAKIFYVGCCDECGTPFMDFGSEGMLEILLTDFFYSKEDNHFNYAEFLKRHYKQVKESKEFEKRTHEGKEIYVCDFTALLEHVKNRWGYEIKDGDMPTIGSI